MISDGAKRRRDAAVTEIPTCTHEKTRLIAKDNDAEYIECLACGAILETHELSQPPEASNAEAPTPNPAAGPEPAKSNPFDESLSDA